MKQGSIQKSMGDNGVTAEQLAKINAFSRRELMGEEVYVFSLILCDNEVDRDFERFPVASLEKLAGLFVGKTGIFDHNPKGENQTSRIFETKVETDKNRMTTAGEAYHALRAWAYMVRCDKNADLILEIDAGIKKEVSVGCAVERTECSICGADVRGKGCAHEAGKTYNGVLCWHELIHPTDAYEWSFVAVPAQKEAGVTKSRSEWEPDLLKALEYGEVSLSKSQAAGLAEKIRGLESLAESGRVRLEGLKREFVRLAAFTVPTVDAATLAQVANGMDAIQLEKLCGGLSKAAPAFLQLGGIEATGKPDFGAFQI